MVEAAFTAAREGNVEPSDVAQILVAGPSVPTMFGSRRPKDHVEAIHSMPYFVASAIADKNFTWVHATPDKIFDPTVQRLMALVDPDPSPPAVQTRWLWAGTVTIVTKSGARITRTVDAPRGSAPRGIEWNDVEEKYRALMPQSRLPARPPRRDPRDDPRARERHRSVEADTLAGAAALSSLPSPAFLPFFFFFFFFSVNVSARPIVNEI